MTDAPVLTVRPLFIGWIALLVQLPIQLFLTLWAGGFFGGFATMSGLFERDSRAPFIVFGALAFFAVPAIAYFGKKLNYEHTEYRFFGDRLEFDEGFLTINKKVVRFRDVKEVTLRKGVLQRIYGLGSIYLATLATGSTYSFSPFRAFGFGNVSGSGVSVRDVRDPEQMFDKIRQIVDAQTA